MQRHPSNIRYVTHCSFTQTAPDGLTSMAYIITYPWNVMFGIVAAVTIAGNSLFVVVFHKSHRLRRMRTSVLLISLAAADLIVGAIAIPMYMALVWPGGDLQKIQIFNKSYYLIDLVSGLASLFALTLIALERVYSVFWPHKHRALTKIPYCVALLTSWCLAVFQAVLRLLQWNNLMTLEEFFFSMFSWMSIVVIVIMVSYCAVWIKVRANRRGGQHVRRVEQEKKMAKTLAILTGMFLISWLPFHFLNMVLFLCVPCRNKCLHLVYAIKLLHFSNSLVNPVIYSFRFPEVRRTLALIFCRRDHIVAPNETRMIGMAHGQRGAVIPAVVDHIPNNNACEN